MDNNTIDILIILTVKFLLTLGFFFLLKFWVKKSKNIIPIILYWVFGLFFVFVFITDIIRVILISTLYQENSLMRNEGSIDSISSLLGLIIYIFIGVKYFKRKKQFSSKISD